MYIRDIDRKPFLVRIYKGESVEAFGTERQPRPQVYLTTTMHPARNVTMEFV